MTARSTLGGSRRPTVAPSWPPMVEPIAISSATPQSTWPPSSPGMLTKSRRMNAIAAIPLTMRASTFLVALCRCIVSYDADAEDRHQQDALRGAEVAAVHTRSQDGGPHPPDAVLGHAASLCRHARRRAAEIRGPRTTSTQPEHDQHRHDRVERRRRQQQEQHRPDDAAEQRGAAQAEQPGPLARAARAR